jgi:biotin carboxyl carrier protein
MWIDLTKDAAIPAQLHNQLSVKKGGTGDAMEADVPAVKVLTQLPEIMSPLRGKSWVAANGPSNASQHRRAMLVIDGTPHISQRYAIDWVQADAGNKTYHGDSKDNRNYYCFGAEAHAVADATVVEVKDGIPENVPNQQPAVPITLETIAGNHVNLDLGGGVYAMYAHFQPGSIRVKVGDKVTPGQVLGLVGNTGNSSEPHLHFQLMNSNSPLGSEGLPYALPVYQYAGKVTDDGGKAKLDKSGAPAARHGEMPLEDEVTDFEP